MKVGAVILWKTNKYADEDKKMIGILRRVFYKNAEACF